MATQPGVPPTSAHAHEEVEQVPNMVSWRIHFHAIASVLWRRIRCNGGKGACRTSTVTIAAQLLTATGAKSTDKKMGPDGRPVRPSKIPRHAPEWSALRSSLVRSCQLEEALDAALAVETDRVGRRYPRETRHGHDIAADRHNELRPRGQANLTHRERMVRGRSLQVRVGGE